MRTPKLDFTHMWKPTQNYNVWAVKPNRQAINRDYKIVLKQIMNKYARRRDVNEESSVS